MIFNSQYSEPHLIEFIDIESKELDKDRYL